MGPSHCGSFHGVSLLSRVPWSDVEVQLSPTVDFRVDHTPLLSELSVPLHLCSFNFCSWRAHCYFFLLWWLSCSKLSIRRLSCQLRLVVVPR